MPGATDGDDAARSERVEGRMSDFHFYEPRLGHGLPHDPFKAIVAPRPIGWISSVDGEGRVNLAPYSFFNAFSLKSFPVPARFGEARAFALWIVRNRKRQRGVVARLKGAGVTSFNTRGREQPSDTPPG